ncbi:alpha/beta hydrolase fold-domain-containing protein [Clohesyomyces aquaticus]|uniref:Alpha/beta hydrolase fold-domain-containing protein n=1 Tax=Clohesyomyces aquaticus TaxID=1231657 RepID=A0A1Y1ZQW4_9PLEO|nr:alpha/beta hydrolase fold-domain-containing protein [Clohesyomyces aquaticus]
MLLQFLYTKLAILPRLFQPSYDATFSILPFWQRWRLLLILQPINLLVPIITAQDWLFNNRYSVVWIPVRDGSKRRCLVYLPPGHTKPTSSSAPLTSLNKVPRKLLPLHIDIHPGAFIGGFPEHSTRWCSHLSTTTSTIVISLSHRLAPRNLFPAAHNDIDDLVSWILVHAEQEFGADPGMLTIGGSSAGANLALSAAIMLQKQNQEQDQSGRGGGYVANAFLGFYTPLDLRITPPEKPRPANFPSKDPMAVLIPLYTSYYAAPIMQQEAQNPRLNPIVAEVGDLPRDMLFIVPEIDILVHEQLSFVERVRGELERGGDGGTRERRVDAKVIERAFHGWVECTFPDSISFLSDD